jgi:hypothetical protein
LALDGWVTNVLIGVVLFFMLGLSIGLQIVRMRRAPLGRVVGILSNVKHNERLCENFSFHRGIGKMKASAWQKNKNRVDFLPQELRTRLSQLFEMVGEVNELIDAAIRHKSDSYMAAIDIDKLKPPLATCREQLQEWVYANMHNPDYLPKRRSLFRR